MSTCTNHACKRTFKKPIKALNLQDENAEPYDACPYCLTKIDAQSIKKETRIIVEKKPEKRESEVKTSPKKDETSECKHHLGYLSVRGQKEQIPDECLVCKNIVECMLSKMR